MRRGGKGVAGALEALERYKSAGQHATRRMAGITVRASATRRALIQHHNKSN